MSKGLATDQQLLRSKYTSTPAQLSPEICPALDRARHLKREARAVAGNNYQNLRRQSKTDFLR